jgi:site-specific recombinase XerC
VVRQLAEFLGHDDAKRVTTENLIGWKQSMVEAGLRPKTIQDAKLAPLRAIFQWGVQNRRIASNPAEGVSLDVRTKQGEKKRSFTDEEAKVTAQVLHDRMIAFHVQRQFSVPLSTAEFLGGLNQRHPERDAGRRIRPQA